MDKTAHHHLTNRSVILSYICGRKCQEKRTVSDLVARALRLSEIRVRSVATLRTAMTKKLSMSANRRKTVAAQLTTVAGQSSSMAICNGEAVLMRPASLANAPMQRISAG